MARAMEWASSMKLDAHDDDQLPDGCFRHDRTLMKLERQLFAHVRELGDLRRLSGLEEVLYCVLADELAHDLALDLSRLMVTSATELVIRHPERNLTSVPHGISRAERFAAFFEEGCPFCESKVDLAEDAPPDDDCECCAMLVREWRAQHAEALRRFRHPPGADRNSRLGA